MKLQLRKVIPPYGCISLRAMSRAAGVSRYFIDEASKRGDFETIKIAGERETWVRDEDAAVWIAEQQDPSRQKGSK